MRRGTCVGLGMLIEQAASASGLKLTPENIAVDDGLKKKTA